MSTLHELKLAGTDMQKADFNNLPSSLLTLDLSKCELSIASFRTLYVLVDLIELDLRGFKNSNITGDDVNELKNALPNCKIHY